MYCPKCGTENPEGAKICRNCSCALMGVAPTVSPPARTSAMAIASLVLGLLSFCTFFLTAPLAVIFGIISLVVIARSHGQLKGTGMAIAGIVVPIVMLPLVAILMGIMMPALARTRCIIQRKGCEMNMMRLEKSMGEYAADNNGRYPIPSQWCDLLQENDPNLLLNTFRCIGVKEGPSNYAMNKNAETASAGTPADMVLLFESKAGWNQSGGPELLITDNHCEKGCNILFNDGHVEFIRVEDVNELRWTAGQ